MITLKEKKMLLKMKAAMNEPIDELQAQIEAEEQKLSEQSESRKSAFNNIFAGLAKNLNELAVQDKKRSEEQQSLVDQLGSLFTKMATDPQVPQEIKEEFIKIDEAPEKAIDPVIDKQTVEASSPVERVVAHVKETTAPSMFVQPNPPTVDKDIKAIQNKLKLLEGWVSKISMAGPGGGAVWLRDLEDVAHYPVKNALHGHALVYNATTKKWEPHYLITTGDTAPAYPNDGDVWYNTTDAHTYIWLIENEVGQWVDIIGGSTNIITTTVTTSTYTVGPVDNYIGVNFAGPVTITLPAVAALGRMLIIKDESGRCSHHTITLSGNVDNDAGGATLQVDNGSLQLVYRAGWRVV